MRWRETSILRPTTNVHEAIKHYEPIARIKYGKVQTHQRMQFPEYFTLFLAVMLPPIGTYDRREFKHVWLCQQRLASGRIKINDYTIKLFLLYETRFSRETQINRIKTVLSSNTKLKQLIVNRTDLIKYTEWITLFINLT